MKICLAPTCERLARTKQLCDTHYYRQKRYGSFELPRVKDRLLSRIRVNDSGCWVWVKGVYLANGMPYGAMKALGEKAAHRISYRLFKGDIPEEFCIDHLCCNTLCVNPDHLEVVTQQENCQRTVQRNRHRWAGYQRPECSVGNCNRPAEGLGLCHPHYARAYRARKRTERLAASTPTG